MNHPFDESKDLVTPETKWKYLRETSGRYFNPDRNTPLCDYLEAIFPSRAWVYNRRVEKQIQLARGSKKTRQFRPDARCEELDLIVEFDGLPHYQDIMRVIDDQERDGYFESLGYTVVRIPYFIQLSNVNIQHLFHVDVAEPMCQLRYSFFDTGGRAHGLDIAPGSMCELGVERFVKDFKSFPKDTQEALVQDLLLVASTVSGKTERPLDWVVPRRYQEDIFGPGAA